MHVALQLNNMSYKNITLVSKELNKAEWNITKQKPCRQSARGVLIST